MDHQKQNKIIEAAVDQGEAFNVLVGVFDGRAMALLALVQDGGEIRTVTITVENEGREGEVVEVVACDEKIFFKRMPKETAWQCAKDMQTAALAVGFDPHKEMRTLTGPVEPPADASDVKGMLKFRASLLETCATDSWTMMQALKRIEELEHDRDGNVDRVREADRLSEGDGGAAVGDTAGEPKPRPD